jgi:hypothetical protein
MLQTMCGIKRGLESFEIKIVKEFQTIKGPPKVDNPITCEVDNLKMWPLLFSGINMGVEF